MNYKEHSEIAIPEWLIGWEDFSWHNDAMPHSILFLRGQEGPNVEAWINYPDPADREIGTRFGLVYRIADDIEMGGDETLYEGEDENEAREWAQAAVIARDMITSGDLKQAVPFMANTPHVYRILALYVTTLNLQRTRREERI